MQVRLSMYDLFITANNAVMVLHSSLKRITTEKCHDGLDKLQLFHKNVTRNVTSSCLPYFRSILPFYTLWKHQRKECCLVFPEGIEKKYWPDKGLNMTQYWEKDLLLFGFRKIVNVSLNYCFRNWLSDHFTFECYCFARVH